jgi:alpha-beta hydrolase superfamily lysophospholipase
VIQRLRRLSRYAAGLVAVVIVMIVGANIWANWLPSRLVSEVGVDPGADHRTLFVLVHGMLGDRDRTWKPARAALQPYGDVLAVNYPGFALSNADPDGIAREISAAVEGATAGRSYDSIVLVGHSMGALLVRKAYLYARGDVGTPHDAKAWVSKVGRIVLMAGTNRGWSYRAHRPLDMGWGRYWEFWAGWWFGRLTGSGTLVRSMETGAPFVANLRLEWMRALRNPTKPSPEVVQLLGDIDDVVSDEDNKDLRAATSQRFTWLRVRGTGHGDIVRFDDGHREGGSQTLGAYRRDKFLLAATKTLEEVRRQNEEQPFRTDDRITHVVFILHGIRDLGRWSASFEPVLLREFRRRNGEDAMLAIASVRYGFFGMGPFILRMDRQRYVRWFMDEYTETLARYPNAARVDFVGHSNGTYLLTDALRRYHAMKVDRVVLAGSVVRRDFQWEPLVARSQVGLVRNYVASDDWVVALFPRFFEQRPLRFLGNDIGSAGFNGFDRERMPRAAAVVKNIKFIQGNHAAFLEQIGPIVDFLLAPAAEVNIEQDNDRCVGSWGWVVWVCGLKGVSDYASWAVWMFLSGLVVGGGWLSYRIAGRYRVYALLAYAMVVAVVLYKA